MSKLSRCPYCHERKPLTHQIVTVPPVLDALISGAQVTYGPRCCAECAARHDAGEPVNREDSLV